MRHIIRGTEPAGFEGQVLIEASPQQLVEQARRRDRTSAAAFAQLIGRYEKTALALAYSIDAPGNAYFHQPAIKEWVHAGV